MRWRGLVFRIIGLTEAGDADWESSPTMAIVFSIKKINLAVARFRLKNDAATYSCPSGRRHCIFLKTFRHRKKIFTTNNHYEWSK
jgi:hypothetical protein